MEGLYDIINHTLLFGGLLVAAWGMVHTRRNPPDTKALTTQIVSHSWKTLEVGILLASLLTFYILAAGAGRFFYEEQLPAARLVITLCIYAVIVWMIARGVKKNGGNWDEQLGMGAAGFRKTKLAPVFYLAFIPFLMLATKGYHLLLESLSGAEPSLQDVAEIVTRERSWLEIVYMLSAVFIAPVYEEMLFRGVLFPYLAKRTGLVGGIVLASVFFGALHLHLPSFVPLFLLSAMLCLTYWRTGSLWTSIGVHMIFNAVSILALNIKG